MAIVKRLTLTLVVFELPPYVKSFIKQENV